MQRATHGATTTHLYLESLNISSFYCEIDSECPSGSCSSDNVCVDSYKSCPNECSGSDKGLCMYFEIDRQVQSCTIQNGYCQAVCICHDGWYGPDCSISTAELPDMQIIREMTCAGLVASIDDQDTSVEVVRSTASFVSTLVSDPSIMNDDSIYDCADALLSLVERSLESMGDKDTFDSIFEALSMVRHSHM